MKHYLLIISLFPILSFGQIVVKSQQNDMQNIIAKTDSTKEIENYKTAEQFLGLIGKKIFALPINPKYDTKYTGFGNIKYVAKEKTKTEYRKYNVGDLVPVENRDFYDKNIGNKYFVVKDVKFFKNSFSDTPITAEEWQSQMKFSSTVNNINIYLSSKDLELVVKNDGMYSLDGFLPEIYFEYLKNKYVKKIYLHSNNDDYKVPIDAEDRIKFTQYKPNKINEKDIYTGNEIILEQSDSEHSKYPDLYLIIKNKISNENKKISITKRFSNDLTSLYDYNTYANFYHNYIDKKEKKENEINLAKKEAYELKKKEAYKYGRTMGDKILNGQVELGMDRQAVILALGYPNDINTTKTAYGTREQFIYNKPNYKNEYYYFENGRLTAIQD